MSGKGKETNDIKLEQRVGSNISQESIRVIAESIGISNLPDDAASFLSDQATYRLKTVIQDSMKHMYHAKRVKLSTADMDMTLQAKNVEPIYGMQCPDLIPFRYTSGGGRELHFIEEKEMDLSEVINNALPKIPLELTIKPHWLCIEGVQPAIPENPPAASKELQKKEILDTSVKNMIDKGHKSQKPGSDAVTRIRRKYPKSDMVKLKELTTHELSVEQQYFYKEVTEACVGPDENKRSEALNSLASDPGLHQMLPRFITFVSEGVKINVVQNNLALLIYLMRMVKSLLDNHTLYLEKYLHALIPAVATCVISRQLCLRPDSDNHWALRDFAARLMATICKNFNTSSNNIQSRVSKMFVKAMTSDRQAIATQYGALAGLGEMGQEVMKTCILPHLRVLGDKMRAATEGPIINAVDKIACEHIKKQLTKYLPSVLKASGIAETLEDYTQTFGYLGPLLFSCIQKERQVSVVSGPTPARPTLQIHQTEPSSCPVAMPSLFSLRNSCLTHPIDIYVQSRGPQQILFQQTGSASTPITPSATAFFPASGGQTVRTPSTPSSAGTQQKFVIVTSQPRSVAGSVSEMSNVAGNGTASSAPTIVKLVSTASAPGTATASTIQANSAQKIVVIQGSNIKQEQGVLQSATPAVSGSIVTTSTLPTAIVTTSQEIGMKSIFPHQSGSISLVTKKEEKL